jgi:TatD DNase family protein
LGSPTSRTADVRKLDIKNLQKEIFLKHWELAREVKKPVIIHCREAHQDLLEVLKSEILHSKLRGVVHCFSGNLKQAEKYLAMGFYLGFTGIITYTSSYDKIIKNLPLEKILIETDCPYLAPVPYRGKRNEPVYVKYTAQKIAEIRGLSLEEIAEQTFQNACQLFKI